MRFDAATPRANTRARILIFESTAGTVLHISEFIERFEFGRPTLRNCSTSLALRVQMLTLEMDQFIEETLIEYREDSDLKKSLKKRPMMG